MVETVSPWVTDAPVAHPFTVPLPRSGRPDPEPEPERVQLHEAACSASAAFLTWPSLFLRPVWAKAQAESPRMMRVCFILSNLINHC